MDTARHKKGKHTGLRIDFATHKFTTLAECATESTRTTSPHTFAVHLLYKFFWKQRFLMQDSAFTFIVTRGLLSPA